MDPEQIAPHVMPITPQEIVAPLMWMVFAFTAAWYVGMSASEVKYVRLADGRQQTRKLPLLFRLLLPFVPNVARLFRHKKLENHRAKLDARLISAGYEGLLSAEEFLSIQLLVFLVAVPLSFGMKPALEGLPGIGRRRGDEGKHGEGEPSRRAAPCARGGLANVHANGSGRVRPPEDAARCQPAIDPIRTRVPSERWPVRRR